MISQGNYERLTINSHENIFSENILPNTNALHKMKTGWTHSLENSRSPPMHLIRKYLYRRWRGLAFDALNPLETELIALKDVMEIIGKMPLDAPPPLYLVERARVHTEEISRHFYAAWEVLVKS